MRTFTAVLYREEGMREARPSGEGCTEFPLEDRGKADHHDIS